MKTRMKLLSLGALWCACTVAQAQTARVAVYDPQTSLSGGVVISPPEMDAAAQTLRDAGFDVTRVTSAQIDDPSTFNAGKFDVFVLRGNVVPIQNIPELQEFERQGGVMVALAAANPFRVGVRQGADGIWERWPTTPAYGWETSEISGLFGIRYIYRPALHDNGLYHTPTPLFQKYLPQAREYDGKLSSNWLVATDGGEFIPLMRSRRGDGRDVFPQVGIVRKGNCQAVISLNDFWTGRSDAPWMLGSGDWQLGAQTTVAMVKIAVDLRRGTLKPPSNDAVNIPVDTPAPDPLTSRITTGEVNPDNAPIVTRWGKFDGSGLELNDKSALPRVLAPGGTVTLPLAQNGKPEWLRVRAAIGQSAGGLQVRCGDTTLWNEILSYVDAGGPGNTNAADLAGVPVEFTRRIFVPPTNATSLVLSNPGDQPLYFDAVQLENALPKPMQWVGGMGSTETRNILGGNISYNLPPELLKNWTSMRSPVRTQLAGAPGSANRWDKFDALTKEFLKSGRPLDVVLEGTPQWAAISPERWDAVAVTYRRPALAPDPQKYAEIVRHYVETFAPQIDRYEIWNEANSRTYFIGSPEEYVNLWKTIVPIIREKDPTAQVMTTGLAGWNDRFVDTLIKNDILKEADLFAFHPYSGTAAAWDKPFAEAQGNLYARGQNIEIYNNEMGFVWRDGGYPPTSHPYTEATQARSTSVALARLLASGSSKFSVFLSGGDESGFSVINSQGQPRPAYAVLQDYFLLSQNGGERLDVSLCRADGGAQEGVYVAAARHRDNHLTLIVNPAEAPQMEANPNATIPVRLSIPLPQVGKWTAKTRESQSLPLTIKRAAGSTWGEVTLDLKARTVIQLAP